MQFYKFLDDNSDRKVNLSEIVSAWVDPPYGIKLGLAPILAIALFLARKWLIAGLRKFRRPHQASLSPQQQAHAELDANRLHTDAVPFAEGIHNCILRYFKNEYAIGSESHSTAEIITVIQQQLHLTSQVELDLIRILEQCEHIKFSQQSLDPATRERLDQRAQALLNNLNPTTPGAVT